MIMTKQIVCQDCGGYGFIRTVHNENSISARGCSTCGSTGLIDVSLTNADRIRAMSDEELAKWLLEVMKHKVACFGEGAFKYTPCRNVEHDCVKCGVEWLKQPVEDDDG
jgi:hypothetical protein